MPKAKLVATTTVEVTTDVKLSPKVRQMIVERCEEHARLSKQVKEIEGTKKKPGRMRRIKKEVEELFTKDGQGKALLDGTDINGHSIVMVTGSRNVFDKLGFMKHHGLTEADFAAFTTEEDNEPYLKITSPGEAKEER
jgi:hypothetical protein